MASANAGTPIEILLVEDSPGDVRLTKEVLDEAGVRNTLHVVQDGVEAMSFLRREGVYVDAPAPDHTHSGISAIVFECVTPTLPCVYSQLP